MKFNSFLLIFLLVSLAGCVKYSFRGALPSYLETIYIEDFENNTNYPDVREEFMQKVTQAFIQDNSLRIIDDAESADLVLRGSIASINKNPVSITQTETVQEYQMIVNVRAECLNLHTDKPLWKTNLSRFGVISGQALRSEIDLAISEAVDQLVEDVVTQTVAAW
ncbi:MAG: LptE family protein [Calditrichia bacterium]